MAPKVPQTRPRSCSLKTTDKQINGEEKRSSGGSHEAKLGNADLAHAGFPCFRFEQTVAMQAAIAFSRRTIRKSFSGSARGRTCSLLNESVHPAAAEWTQPNGQRQRIGKLFGKHYGVEHVNHAICAGDVSLDRVCPIDFDAVVGVDRQSLTLDRLRSLQFHNIRRGNLTGHDVIGEDPLQFPLVFWLEKILYGACRELREGFVCGSEDRVRTGAFECLEQVRGLDRSNKCLKRASGNGGVDNVIHLRSAFTKSENRLKRSPFNKNVQIVHSSNRDIDVRLTRLLIRFAGNHLRITSASRQTASFLGSEAGDGSLPEADLMSQSILRKGQEAGLTAPSTMARIAREAYFDESERPSTDRDAQEGREPASRPTENSRQCRGIECRLRLPQTSARGAIAETGRGFARRRIVAAAANRYQALPAKRKAVNTETVVDQRAASDRDRGRRDDRETQPSWRQFFQLERIREQFVSRAWQELRGFEPKTPSERSPGNPNWALALRSLQRNRYVHGSLDRLASTGLRFLVRRELW